MADRDSIQARVEALIIDTPAATVAEIPGWIQAGQKDAEDELVGGFLCMETDVSTKTTASTQLLLTKNARWLRRMNARPYYVDGNDAHRYMAWIHTIEELHKLYPTDPPTDGSPKHIREDKTSIYVYPGSDSNAPGGGQDADDEYYVHIWALYREETLSLGASTNWFTANAENYLVYYAGAEALAYNEAYEKSAIWMLRARAELKKLVRADKLARLGTVDIRPRTDVHASAAAGRM